MRKRILLPVAAVAVLAIGAGLAVYGASRALNAPLVLPSSGAFLEVPRGTGLAAVGREIEQRGWFRHPIVFSLYGRFSGDSRRIRAGEYQLHAGTTAVQLLEKLVAGQVFLHQITIVEGWRFADCLAALRAHPAIEAGTASADEIMTALGRPGEHPEGQFFPDTYYFPRGTPEIVVLARAHEALRAQLERAWQGRAAQGLQVETPYEALILASIIEKETALPAERRLISGVFHRRLARGMRLQTDPTVIYGIGAAFDGNLRSRDLTNDTPYNTYTRRGLPPTPIALPGAGSIEAAVNPEIGEALYFVATGRPDGSHYFSATLEEHDRAVADFQLCTGCTR
jgi:UPF0755 protein